MRISDWSSDVCSSDLHQISARVFLVPRDLGCMRPKGNSLRNAGSNGKRATFVRFDFLDGRKIFAKDRLRSFAAVPKGLNPCLPQRMLFRFREIGRASRRERVWQDGLLSVVAVSLKKKK